MTAMIWLTSPAAVIAGMCLFGTGFGISQNATFVLMIDRMPASGLARPALCGTWPTTRDMGQGLPSSACSLATPDTRLPSP